MEKKKFVIVVAGGSGLRMGANMPKQFLELYGKPILIHTIEKFLQINPFRLILVIPSDHQKTVEEILQKFQLEEKVILIEGGNTRFQSVKNGLQAVKEKEGLVAIHDAVRPMISQSIISASFEKAEQYGSGVVAVALKDSIRKVTSEKNYAVDRSSYQSIQTPQTFDLRILKKAYDVAYKKTFTDDASVYEESGHSIYLVDGDYQNIKITTPEDLEIAKVFLSSQVKKV